MIEQPDAPIGAEENDFPVADPPGLLLGNILREPQNIGLRWPAIEERECRIPFLGDDTVDPLLRR